MLKDQLQKHFGFTSFLKGQEAVIRKVLARQSAAAIFPTGAGKSLCYQLPAMVLPGLTLVVSPLLSLMKDQLDFLLSNDIPAARLDSTLGKNEYNAILESAKNNRLKILMIAVEQFRRRAQKFCGHDHGSLPYPQNMDLGRHSCHPEQLRNGIQAFKIKILDGVIGRRRIIQYSLLPPVLPKTLS